MKNVLLLILTMVSCTYTSDESKRRKIENPLLAEINLIFQDPNVNVLAQDSSGTQLLCQALKTDNLEALQLLLEHPSAQGKINNQFVCEETFGNILFAAVAFDAIKCVGWLLERFPDIELIEKDTGETLYFLSILKETPDILKLLAEKRPNLDPNEANEMGDTPLIHAIKQDAFVETIIEFINLPAVAVDEETVWGKTALMIAAEEDQPEIIDALMTKTRLNKPADGISSAYDESEQAINPKHLYARLLAITKNHLTEQSGRDSL